VYESRAGPAHPSLRGGPAASGHQTSLDQHTIIAPAPSIGRPNQWARASGVHAQCGEGAELSNKGGGMRGGGFLDNSCVWYGVIELLAIEQPSNHLEVSQIHVCSLLLWCW
jgi:hypothetical protein